MTQIHIKKILLDHTETDTVNLICSFITYSSHHGVIYNDNNVFDKTTPHCILCDDCEGCKSYEYYINCDTCHYCYTTINIPIIVVIFDWKLFFCRKLNYINDTMCNCGAIPNCISLVRDGIGITYKFSMSYNCSSCEYYNIIGLLNIIYDDGPIYLVVNCMGERNLILSII